MNDHSQPKDKVQKIYDDMAADYDDKIVPAARYAIPGWLESEFPAQLRRGQGHLLDLGCGSGNLVPVLRKLNPGLRLTGMDLSPKMIEQARQKGVYDELFVHDLDQPLPVRADARFDAALICGALEFVNDPVRLLKDCASRMPAGATLMATFQLSEAAAGFEKIENALGIFQFAYSEPTVRSMLETAGFRPQSVLRVAAYYSPSSGKSCPYFLTRSVRS